MAHRSTLTFKFIDLNLERFLSVFIVLYLLLHSCPGFSTEISGAQACLRSGDVLSQKITRAKSIWAEATKVEFLGGNGEMKVEFTNHRTTASDPLRVIDVKFLKSNCLQIPKVGVFYDVVIGIDGKAMFSRIEGGGVSEQESPSKFPKFDPRVQACNGFPIDAGLAEADLVVRAKVLSIEKDKRKGLSIASLKVLNVRKGPSLKSVKVLEKLGHICEEIGSANWVGDFILFKINDEYYYHDCCGVSGPMDYPGANVQKK